MSELKHRLVLSEYGIVFMRITYMVPLQTNAYIQEDAYNTLVNGAILVDEEQSILKWGLNATGTSPKRLSTGSVKKQTYRAATALECLVRCSTLHCSGSPNEL